MTATEAAAALEEARLQQPMDRDRDDLADDERSPAEVGERERIELLATTGGVYDPEADAVVQDELAAEARAASGAEDRDLQKEMERQDRLHSNGLPDRAHMLQVLEEAGLLGRNGASGAEGSLVLHESEASWGTAAPSRTWRRACISSRRGSSCGPS
ncbi:hypothetical protein ACFWWC_35270 [Streptomyces sp. NPDC058642]|uniref:hypothetical protein n=1 Tax=Streptomyces sp. NPDC058642 TaxID=3346572 RepID=UPI0036598D46